MLNKTKLYAFSLVLAALPPSAIAQDVNQQNVGESAFKRDRNISVQERPKPEYETDGIRSGIFVYRPELRIQTEYDDNVFASDANGSDDLIFVLAPSIDIETDRNVHNLRVFAGAETRQYSSYGDQSHTNFQIGTEGRLDIQRNFYVEAGADYQKNHEDRTRSGAARNTVNPIDVDRIGTFVHGYREAGRTRLQGTARYFDTDFGNAEFGNGTVQDQSFRNRQGIEMEVRGDYAVSPNTAVFGRIRYNNDNYSETLNRATRDQDGFVFDVGADFDITDFVRGEVGVGLLTRSFDDPARSNFEGLSVNGRLEWFATPLITVNAVGARQVQPTNILESAASVESLIGLSADYEYRRNIVFSVGTEFRDENYKSIDRTDERLSYFIAGSYLLNRTAAFNLGITSTRFDSDGLLAQDDFDNVEILFGITLRR